MNRFLSIVLSVVLLAIGAYAVGNCDGAGACYVNAQAKGTGTGVDWTNACTDFTGPCDVTSASMRGTTLYVAGIPGNPIGSPAYTHLNFSAPDSGTTPITIIKASSANHGTSTGWLKEYATGVAVLSGTATISTDYWVFNGQWRAENWRGWHDFPEPLAYPSMCSTGGFWNTGYALQFVNASGTANAVNITGSNVSISYAQINGSRSVTTGTDVGVHYGAGVSNEYLGYSQVCYTGGNLVDMSSATNMTFEYDHFASNHQGSTSLAFPSAINVGDVSGLTIRYNEFRDVTGSVLTDGNTDATAFTPNWYFYGNVVWWISTSVQTSSTRGGLNGIVNLVGETLNSGVVQVYNNTFAELNLSQCTGTGAIPCNAIALNLSAPTGGTCAAHTQNCIGSTAPVGTAYNNFWWDGFSGQNVASVSNAQWTPTGDYGEGACLTTGCSNGGTFTVVGANDVSVTEANPFYSFYRPAVTLCDEKPNNAQRVQDEFNGCYFDFRLNTDTAAGTTPSGWTTAPSGCTSTGGGNCENVDREGVVRGTLGTGSQVSRGAFQYLARRLVNTYNYPNHSYVSPLTTTTPGAGVQVGSTVKITAQCTWTSAPLVDDCPDSTPPFVKTWGAINPDVATIDSTGTVTGVSNHNAVMFLKYGGYTAYNINIVVISPTGTLPVATLPTGIVRVTGPSLSFQSYDTSAFDAAFPTTYSDPCPINGVGGCTRWGTAGSPIPVITTAAQFTQALNGSQPGDTIVLQAGTTYTTNGVFTLPARSNPSHKWTYIISSNESSLPPQGTRVSPNDEPNMAILAEAGGSALLSPAPGADHWWISGLEAICVNTQIVQGDPRPQCGARFDGIEDITLALPDFFVLDRVYFHGDDNHDTDHGVVANVGHFAMLDSYLSTFGRYQQQADSLSGYITNGPIKIINNTIANGWGETSIFGGAGGFSNPYNVQDAYFSHNTIMSNPNYRVSGITIAPPPAKYEYSNNFEFKSCERCLADGNIIENSWASTQAGGQFIMNAGTGPNGPDVVVNDMTFTNNILIGGVNGMGNGGQFASSLNGCDPSSQPCYYPGENRRITILDNLWVQGPQGAPGGRKLIGSTTNGQTLDRFTTDFLFQHNTFVGPYLSDHTYCDSGIRFQPQAGDSPATSNVWLLDNVFCRQVGSNLAGSPTGTTMLNQAMIYPPSVPIACPTGSTTCRFYGNVMEYFPSQGDTAATWPNQNQPINQEGGSPVTYNNPQTGDYTMTSPTQLGTDGVQSGVQYSTIVSHQAPALGSCSIAGSLNGAISSGVAMVLTGQSTTTVYSYTDGTYNFPNLVAGTYTVTPFAVAPYPGTNTYTFSPTNLVITLTAGAGCTSTGNTFTSSAASTFSISGQVTLNGVGQQGVTMKLTGAATGTVTTDSSGFYNFGGLANGAYTVTPSLTGYTFTPTSTPVTISNANVTGINFTSAPSNVFSISGTISGASISGVTLTLSGQSGGTTTSASDGTYSFTNLGNGGYTVTPSKTGYTFSPTSSPVTISGANVPNVNFSDSAISSHIAFGSGVLLGTGVQHN